GHDQRALQGGDDQVRQRPRTLRADAVGHQGPRDYVDEGVEGLPRSRARPRLGPETGGHHRTPRDVIGGHQTFAPQVDAGAHRVHHAETVDLRRQRPLDPGGRPVRRLFDELRLTAGKVVVDRAARCPAVLEHVPERRGRDTSFAHQRDRAGDHRRARSVPPFCSAHPFLRQWWLSPIFYVCCRTDPILRDTIFRGDPAMTDLSVTTHVFDAAVDLFEVRDDHTEGHTHPAYANMVGPFGGITAATLLRA